MDVLLLVAALAATMLVSYSIYRMGVRNWNARLWIVFVSLTLIQLVVIAVIVDLSVSPPGAP